MTTVFSINQIMERLLVDHAFYCSASYTFNDRLVNIQFWTEEDFEAYLDQISEGMEDDDEEEILNISGQLPVFQCSADDGVFITEDVHDIIRRYFGNGTDIRFVPLKGSEIRRDAAPATESEQAAASSEDDRFELDDDREPESELVPLIESGQLAEVNLPFYYDFDAASWVVSTTMCQLGGCFTGIRKFESERAAYDYALHLTQAGQDHKVSGACHSCYSEYLGDCGIEVEDD